MNTIDISKVFEIYEVKKVSILTNLCCKDYNFDSDKFFSFLNYIKNKNIEVTIYERKFKDTNLRLFNEYSYELIKDNIQFKLITTEDLNRVRVKNFQGKIFDEIYVYGKLFLYDVVIILTKASLHIHHSKKYLFSCDSELILSSNLNYIEYENYYRKEIVTILRDEFDLIFNHIKNLHLFKNNFYGVLDGTNIKITNEHIPFFYKTRHDETYQGQNLNDLKVKLLKSLI